MLVIDYSAFKDNMNSYIDRIIENQEITVVKCEGKNVVIMSQGNYNSLMETLYLEGNEANNSHLKEAIRQYKKIITYKGYSASLEYDFEDNIFVGEVIGINDSLNFHGDTVKEAEAMFHQSIENYLEMCKKYDKVPEN